MQQLRERREEELSEGREEALPEGSSAGITGGGDCRRDRRRALTTPLSPLVTPALSSSGNEIFYIFFLFFFLNLFYSSLFLASSFFHVVLYTPSWWIPRRCTVLKFRSSIITRICATLLIWQQWLPQSPLRTSQRFTAINKNYPPPHNYIL